MQKLYITLLSFLIWSFSLAQQYTNYSTKNGLPSNHVYRISQDVDGFIWFITDKGMVKYDGTNFKKFAIRDGLPTNDIWSIITTPNGKVWYFSKSPKIGYIKKDSIYAFPSAVKSEILNPSVKNIVGNTITFDNNNHHYELKNKKWKRKSTFNRKMYQLFIKHPTIDRFQFNENNTQISFIDKNERLIKKIKNTYEIKMAHTRGQINDSIYLWLSDKAYTVLNLHNFELKSTLFKDVINITKSKYVRMHVVNNQVQITGKGFVSQLDSKYTLINTHYIPKHLKAHFSFIDKQGNLWVATFTNGVYKFPKFKQNAVYDLVNEKAGKIVTIINGELMTTVLDKGFYQYDHTSKHFKLSKKETDFTYGVFDIKELNKTYFITTYKITSVDNGNKKKLYNFSFNETARQLVYHNNYLYGNFSLGLNKLEPENLSVAESYLSYGIRTFVSFKKKLIIATSNGLKVLNKDSIQPLKFNNTDYTNLYKKPILSLKKLDDNSLLVGTDSYGAFITNLEKITPLKETEYLSINDSFIEKNNLWLATDSGVLHYIKNNTNFTYITTYNENDGLLLNNVRSVYATDTDLIVSSNRGVTTIPKIKKNSKPFLDIYVSHIHYNNKQITAKKVLYTENNTLNFKVSSIDFSENNNFEYEYQLLPVQKKWKTVSSKNILFNDLQPGDYDLSVRSKGKLDSVSFEILPLWHQTILAKIIFGLIVLSFFVGVVLLVRKRELKKQEKKLKIKIKIAGFELRALRSQMNPHFVFNSLNAIQYFITKNEIDLSEKYLVKFARLIRMFFDFSREKKITLAQEINLLKGYLEIEKMRFGNHFLYNFNIDSSLNINEINIPTMLLQPIVENAVNHGVFHNGGKGLIEVSFQFIDINTYKVVICDDGVGVERSKQIQEQSLKQKEISNSKSTDVINERIELLNQSTLWHITYNLMDNSKTIKGTSVELIFRKNE